MQTVRPSAIFATEGLRVYKPIRFATKMVDRNGDTGPKSDQRLCRILGMAKSRAGIRTRIRISRAPHKVSQWSGLASKSVSTAVLALWSNSVPEVGNTARPNGHLVCAARLPRLEIHGRLSGEMGAKPIFYRVVMYRILDVLACLVFKRSLHKPLVLAHACSVQWQLSTNAFLTDWATSTASAMRSAVFSSGT